MWVNQERIIRFGESTMTNIEMTAGHIDHKTDCHTIPDRKFIWHRILQRLGLRSRWMRVSWSAEGKDFSVEVTFMTTSRGGFFVTDMRK